MKLSKFEVDFDQAWNEYLTIHRRYSQRYNIDYVLKTLEDDSGGDTGGSLNGSSGTFWNGTTDGSKHHLICSSPWPRTCYTILSASVIISLALIIIFIITVGNTLVIIAVFREPKLKKMRQNWLIVSLAAADILVGCLIMPMTLTYEIIGEWTFGWLLCELWLALDVLFVTSSILNLCAISLDRYWSLTDPMQYPKKRTPKRMGLTIMTVWLVSFLICFPPLVGWRPQRTPGQCTLSQDVAYVLYSALGSFYIPVIVLMIVYVRIFRIIRERSNARMREATDRRTALALTAVLTPLKVCARPGSLLV